MFSQVDSSTTSITIKQYSPDYGPHNHPGNPSHHSLAPGSTHHYPIISRSILISLCEPYGDLWRFPGESANRRNHHYFTFCQ